MLDDLEGQAMEMQHGDEDGEQNGKHPHLNAGEYEQHPATPTKKAKLAQDASPLKTTGRMRKGITDTEIEGTDDAKLPQAAQPVRNPFLVEAAGADAGATAKGPPATCGPHRAAGPEHEAGQAHARAEQAQARPQGPQERARPQDITTIAQLAAMIQAENDTVKATVGRRMDKI